MIQWTHIHVVLSEMDLRAVSLQTTSIVGEKKEQKTSREISSKLGVRTLCFHCQGPGFNPWLGN